MNPLPLGSGSSIGKSLEKRYHLLRKIIYEKNINSNTLYEQKNNLNLLINESFNSVINYGKRGGQTQKLYCDFEKKEKECGRCHKILSFNSFFMTYSNSNKPRPYCKQCQYDLSIIQYNRKKLIVISQLFNLKCQKCSLSILYLPSIQFHHLNQNEKKISWRIISKSSLNSILIKLKNENVILLCSNCHLEEQAIIFNKFKKIIMEKDLFTLSPEKINDLILKNTSHHNNKLKRMHIREKIREWIKKRYVIELQNNGKCIGCGLSINDHIPAFEMHHLEPYDIHIKNKWEDIERLKIQSIIRIMNEQKCIFLCSNCHISIHSRFYAFLEEIFKDFFEKTIEKYLIKLIRSNYTQILKNLRHFQFKINESMEDPFTLKLTHRDNWKIHLLRLYSYSLKTEDQTFKAYDLNIVMKISMRHVYKHLNRFIEQNIIEKVYSHKGKFHFTNFGKNYVKNLKKEDNDLANLI